MKIISLMLAALVCISLCGCKKKPETISSLPTYTSLVSSDSESGVSSVLSQADESSEVSSVESKAKTPSASSATTTTSSTPKHTECSHTFSTSRVNPTCTKDGAETQICTKCFIEVKNTIKATGHKMSDGRCTICGYADVTECRNKVSNWLQTNHGGKYTLDDNSYYIKTAGGGNLFFSFDDGSCGIVISVYGWEKNRCYIEYITNNALYTTEGEFPMDSVHSTNRIYFNQMNSTADGTVKEQQITELRGKIDGVLLKFQQVMQSNIGISLKDIGFTAY